MMNDAKLLKEYLHEQSEEAFRTLVRQHADLVYGTAFRKTSDAGAAEEISQNVFVALARKAMWLQGEASIAGWLHQTALLEARQWWRGEMRRRQRDETAAELETTMKRNAGERSIVTDLLDDGLLELREGERQAVLLRFMEGRNHREIGEALGIGEDAARKRVDKAIDELHAFFKKRGVAVGGVPALAALLGGSLQAAPAGFAGKAAATALATGASGSLILTKLLGMSRAQIAAVLAVLVLLPVLWQGSLVMSAMQERKRMETMLASLQQQSGKLAREEESLLRQLRVASNSLVRLQSGGKSLSDEELSANGQGKLYLWDEMAEYVRVPKKSLDWLAFDGENSSSYVGAVVEEESMINKEGKVSPTLLNVLGLSETEQEKLQAYVQACVKQYGTFAESQTQMRGMEAFPKNAPSFVRTNENTRVWAMAAMDEAMQEWKAHFKKGIAEITGEERADVLLLQAKRDNSLNQLFQEFGANEVVIVVTPLPDGGVSLARNTPSNGRSRWQGGYNVATSNLISDKLRAKHMKGFLERDMPEPMLEYVREWKKANPGVPDEPVRKP